MREEQAAYRCIVEELAKQICSGTLCQDAPLSSVSVIAKELSLRKRTVRSVIKSLKTMGVVETRKGKGDFLVGNVSEILSNLLHVMLLLQKFLPLKCASFAVLWTLLLIRLRLPDVTNWIWRNSENCWNRFSWGACWIALQQTRNPISG